MQKFNRVYSLQVEVEDGVNVSPLRPEFRANKNVTITLPNTVEFSITRQIQGSSQKGSFKVFNLSEPVRNAIQKDLSKAGQLRAIQFRCGYEAPTGTFMPLVFNGTVQQAFSSRERENWITEIEAYDGGWQMATGNNVSLSIAPNTPRSEVITQLAASLPNTQGVPIIGSFPGANKRGEVLFGNTWKALQQKTNGLVTIDNGQVKALNFNEVFAGEILVISAEAGLLGSPKRTLTSVDFEMIFEPRLSAGQVVELQTTSNKQLNRRWKVMGFEHQGTISPVVSGDCLTHVRLWLTDKELLEVEGVPVT